MTGFLQRIPDCLQDSIEILAHFIIPKAEDANADLGEKRFTRTIFVLTPGMRMTGAVELDGESSFRTIEIENVSIDRMLTPEFVAAQSSVAQLTPEDPLGRGGDRA